MNILNKVNEMVLKLKINKHDKMVMENETKGNIMEIEIKKNHMLNNIPKLMNNMKHTNIRPNIEIHKQNKNVKNNETMRNELNHEMKNNNNTMRNINEPNDMMVMLKQTTWLMLIMYL